MRRALFFLSLNLWAVSVPTSQMDNARTGANAQEAQLNPASFSTFRRLGSYAVDGAVWGQPLIAQNIPVAGVYRDLLVVCTMHDSCLAFDANQPGVALWSVSLGTSRTVYPDNGGTILYGREVGCLATPVIDLAHWTLYAVCGTSAPAWVLAKISLTNGALLGSVVISGQAAGTGDPTGGDRVTGGIVSFYPDFALARSGLVLGNGNVYVAFSSYGDYHPFHGWVFSYSQALTQNAVLCLSPNGYGASVWQAGSAPALDTAGNLFFLTGNGDTNGNGNYGESLVKLSPTLQILDWFTPSNYAALNTGDLDLSSGRALLIPGTTLVTWGSKDAYVNSVDAGCLGHLQGSSNCTLQRFVTNAALGGQSGGIYGGGAYQDGTLYVPVVAGPIYSFNLTSSTWNASPTVGPTSYPYPGTQLTVSSNSGKTPILWGLTATSSVESGAHAGTLRAFNPVTLAEYWDSDQRSGDALGTLAKFTAPTLANGRVYVSTLDNTIQVYGLAAVPVTSQLRGNAKLRGTARLR